MHVKSDKIAWSSKASFSLTYSRSSSKWCKMSSTNLERVWFFWILSMINLPNLRTRWENHSTLCQQINREQGITSTSFNARIHGCSLRKWDGKFVGTCWNYTLFQLRGMRIQIKSWKVLLIFSTAVINFMIKTFPSVTDCQPQRVKSHR